MRLVSSFLKTIVYPTLSTSGVFRRIAGQGLAVLTYHGVIPNGYEVVDAGFDGNLISAKALQEQLQQLKKSFNIIAPEDVLSWLQEGRALPERAVLLTCDDGLLNNLTEMLPILQAEGLKCLFFVTGASTTEARSMLWYEELFLLLTADLRAAPRTEQSHSLKWFEVSRGGLTIRGELGSREQRRSIWWNVVKQVSRFDADTRKGILTEIRGQLVSTSWRGFDAQDPVSCRRYAFMTGQELLQLAAAGMTIGAHTSSHPILSQLPLELARVEVVESKAWLEHLLQRNVWAFAFPFGDAQSVTPQVLELPSEAGYAAAFLNHGGGLGVELPAHALPRIHVTANMNLAEMEAHVSGFYMQLKNTANIS
jgi:peptidoglycan/xylan/chitin deacetylase (PgdA/CDA1 family)